MLAIANAIEEGRLPGVSIELVVCDKPSAPVLKKAQELKLNTFVFEAKKFRKKSDYESEICLLYTSPSPRDRSISRMPSSA